MHTNGDVIWEIDIEIDPLYQPDIEVAALTQAIHLALTLTPARTGHPLSQMAGRANPIYQVGLTITDDETVQGLNLTYRQVEGPTDVLSFSGLESTPETPDFSFPDEEPLPVGDLVIAFPYSARQAARYGQEINAELRLLAVHGVLHLLGYDHGDEAEEVEMWAWQNQILAQLGDPGLGDRNFEE